MSFSFCKQLASILHGLLCSAKRTPSFITSLLFGVLFFIHTNTAYAQSRPSKSYKIKAGFLLQLTSYVTWPSTNLSHQEDSKNTTNHIEVCIVGYDPFGQFIDEMIAAHPATNKGQSISIRRIMTGRNLTGCHVVFITERSIDYTFWQSLPSDHTYLLVSEYNGFLQNGGMISLKENKKRIQLNINLKNSQDKKIIINPELLRVSTIITAQVPKE